MENITKSPSEITFTLEYIVTVKLNSDGQCEMLDIPEFIAIPTPYIFDNYDAAFRKRTELSKDWQFGFIRIKSSVGDEFYHQTVSTMINH